MTIMTTGPISPQQHDSAQIAQQIQHNPITLLRALKGAPLACVVAMRIANQPVGPAWLESATGYAHQAISKALQILRELHIAIQISRFNGWILTEQGQQLVLPLPSTADYQPSALSSSSYISPNKLLLQPPPRAEKQPSPGSGPQARSTGVWAPGPFGPSGEAASGDPKGLSRLPPVFGAACVEENRPCAPRALAFARWHDDIMYLEALIHARHPENCYHCEQRADGCLFRAPDFGDWAVQAEIELAETEGINTAILVWRIKALISGERNAHVPPSHRQSVAMRKDRQ